MLLRAQLPSGSAFGARRDTRNEGLPQADQMQSLRHGDLRMIRQYLMARDMAVVQPADLRTRLPDHAAPILGQEGAPFLSAIDRMHTLFASCTDHGMVFLFGDRQHAHTAATAPTHGTIGISVVVLQEGHGSAWIRMQRSELGAGRAIPQERTGKAHGVLRLRTGAR